MRAYHQRFSTGLLHERITQIALDCERFVREEHVGEHAKWINASAKAKAEALHKAAAILRQLEGEYDEPYPS